MAGTRKKKSNDDADISRSNIFGTNYFSLHLNLYIKEEELSHLSWPVAESGYNTMYCLFFNQTERPTV